MSKTRKRYTLAEWHAEARRRFGDDAMAWAFVCPVCTHVATVADWKAAGASENEVAFSCVGRHAANPRRPFSTMRAANDDAREGPCDYAGGGLFRLNPVDVVDEAGNVHQMFDFAEPDGEASEPTAFVTRNPDEMSAAALDAGAETEEIRPARRRPKRAKGGAA